MCWQIYNEQVRDLFSTSEGHSLRVREHPSRGAFVEGLSAKTVTSYQQVQHLLAVGMASRATAATAMNEVSSRSHAIFTINIKVRVGEKPMTHSFRRRKIYNVDLAPGPNPNPKSDPASSFRMSKICLVDLAGSERANSTCAKGDRLREASNINKSLSTLGDVIKALAKRADSSGGSGAQGGNDASRKRGAGFIPYRNSVLTWLLKDSLGGNSKTVMLAAISPLVEAYQETMSTLRYVERAKGVVNAVAVNEEETNPLVLRLREEVQRLRTMLDGKEAEITEMARTRKLWAATEEATRRRDSNAEEMDRLRSDLQAMQASLAHERALKEDALAQAWSSEARRKEEKRRAREELASAAVLTEEALRGVEEEGARAGAALVELSKERERVSLLTEQGEADRRRATQAMAEAGTEQERASKAAAEMGAERMRAERERKRADMAELELAEEREKAFKAATLAEEQKAKTDAAVEAADHERERAIDALREATQEKERADAARSEADSERKRGQETATAAAAEKKRAEEAVLVADREAQRAALEARRSESFRVKAEEAAMKAEEAESAGMRERENTVLMAADAAAARKRAEAAEKDASREREKAKESLAEAEAERQVSATAMGEAAEEREKAKEALAEASRARKKEEEARTEALVKGKEAMESCELAAAEADKAKRAEATAMSESARATAEARIAEMERKKVTTAMKNASELKERLEEALAEANVHRKSATTAEAELNIERERSVRTAGAAAEMEKKAATEARAEIAAVKEELGKQHEAKLAGEVAHWERELAAVEARLQAQSAKLALAEKKEEDYTRDIQRVREENHAKISRAAQEHEKAMEDRRAYVEDLERANREAQQALIRCKEDHRAALQSLKRDQLAELARKEQEVEALWKERLVHKENEHRERLEGVERNHHAALQELEEKHLMAEAEQASEALRAAADREASEHHSELASLVGLHTQALRDAREEAQRREAMAVTALVEGHEKEMKEKASAPGRRREKNVVKARGLTLFFFVGETSLKERDEMVAQRDVEHAHTASQVAKKHSEEIHKIREEGLQALHDQECLHNEALSEIKASQQAAEASAASLREACKEKDAHLCCALEEKERTVVAITSAREAASRAAAAEAETVVSSKALVEAATKTAAETAAALADKEKELEEVHSCLQVLRQEVKRLRDTMAKERFSHERDIENLVEKKGQEASDQLAMALAAACAKSQAEMKRELEYLTRVKDAERQEALRVLGDEQREVHKLASEQHQAELETLEEVHRAAGEAAAAREREALAAFEKAREALESKEHEVQVIQADALKQRERAEGLEELLNSSATLHKKELLGHRERLRELGAMVAGVCSSSEGGAGMREGTTQSLHHRLGRLPASWQSRMEESKERGEGGELEEVHEGSGVKGIVEEKREQEDLTTEEYVKELEETLVRAYVEASNARQDHLEKEKGFQALSRQLVDLKLVHAQLRARLEDTQIELLHKSQSRVGRLFSKLAQDFARPD
ncbi:unnamed protein product, partial [Discosporangium mesarthrocarpum]